MTRSTKTFATALAVVVALALARAAQSAPRRGEARAAGVTAARLPQATRVQADSVPHPLDENDLAAWLDGLVPYALKSGGIAGADLVVVKDGKVLLERGYGYADIAAKIRMDPQRTMVRPGSTSKLFTWTAVMQLVAQGKLDLDRDVDDYLDFRIPHKNGKAVTLRDLMNHRPGFEEGVKDLIATDPRGLESNERYLKEHPRPMLFTPGEVPAYSNYGAALAGYIVQRISGEPFERYVQEHIFQPLGMEHSTFLQPLPKRFQGAVARGYATSSSPVGPYELVVPRPAGSVTTTADDMARFMIAQLQLGSFDGKAILSPETARLMQSPSETARPGFSTMAHGFFYDIHNGRIVIGHGGDTELFHTELDLLPGEDVGIFYSFNSRGSQDAVYGLRAALLDGFMDRYFPAPPSPPTPPALATAPRDAEQIAGRYQSSRRVEHGFLSLFYLLQQSTIHAHRDGTISAPGGPSAPGGATFREVAPQLWRQVDGTDELALTRVRGVKTVIDSQDPTSVLQAVPALRSAPLNLTVLFGSMAILLLVLILWPLAPILRRADCAKIGISSELQRLRLIARVAVAVDVVYLVAWSLMILPILNNQLQFYSSHLDPVLLALEIAGLVAIAAAGVGIWVAWRTFRLDAPWLARVRSVAVAAALLGIVWIGVMGKLISINLNY